EARTTRTNFQRGPLRMSRRLEPFRIYQVRVGYHDGPRLMMKIRHLVRTGLIVAMIVPVVATQNDVGEPRAASVGVPPADSVGQPPAASNIGPIAAAALRSRALELGYNLDHAEALATFKESIARSSRPQQASRRSTVELGSRSQALDSAPT